MKCAVFLLAVAQVFFQAQAYRYCSYSYYDGYGYRHTRHYRCSSSQYCCGTSSCCTMVYARWYLWFVLASFFLIVFIIWWYYRYRYRPRHTVIASPPVPIMTTATTAAYPAPVAGHPVQPNAYPYPGGQPGYPGPGTVNMYPAANAAHFQAFNKQSGLPQGYAPPPPYEPGSGPDYPPRYNPR